MAAGRWLAGMRRQSHRLHCSSGRNCRCRHLTAIRFHRQKWDRFEMLRRNPIQTDTAGSSIKTLLVAG